MRGRSIRTRPKLPPTPDVAHDEPVLGQGWQLSRAQLQILIPHIIFDVVHKISAKRLHLADRNPLARTAVVCVVVAAALWNEVVGVFGAAPKPLGAELKRRIP